MQTSRLAAIVATLSMLALACGALSFGWPAARSADLPQDRLLPFRLPAERPLRITVLGTSLSQDAPWTAELVTALVGCLDRPVAVSVIARPGAAIDWGLSQIAAVAQARPDIVLVEFAINDADMQDGHGLVDARRMHVDLLAGLRAELPEGAIYLMTMNPAQGLRGLVRPRLSAHYRQYARIAQDADAGLIDLYARWLALPPDARGLDADGLHPDPAVANTLIVPALADLLARAAGAAGCSATPL